MKKTGILMAASLTAVLAQLEAQVVLDVRGRGADGTSATSPGVFNDLNTVVTSGNDGFRVLDGFDGVQTGTLTASDMTGSESFGVTVTGLSNWDFTTASNSLDLNTYVSGRGTANIDGGNTGWGVVGGADNTELDFAGEALRIEFNLLGLDAGHQDDFRLQAFQLAKFEVADDRYSYMVVDNSTNSITTSGSGQGVQQLLLGDLVVENGDSLIIAFESFTGSNPSSFQVDQIQVDVVPEPSAYALIGGILALSSVMLRRRRS